MNSDDARYTGRYRGNEGVVWARAMSVTIIKTLNDLKRILSFCVS